jgi:ABC-2 type transport system ATP-binding protein
MPRVTAPAISVRDLRMSYGDIDAVRDVDLEIAPGEVFAFVGPNGAGKTTTVEILEGYRARTGGEVSVLGVDPAHTTRSWRARIGVVLQGATPQALLTVDETLSLYAGYYPAPRTVDEVLAMVGLEEQRGRRAGRLSGGQQRRLDVGVALVGRPELLFLDEPTTGFDPGARRSFWEMIESLSATGTTIFLTTHYMEEAQSLANRVAIIRDGKIVAEGTPAELTARVGRQTIVRFTLPPSCDRTRLPAGLADRVTGEGAHVELVTETPVPDLAALCGWAVDERVELEDLEASRPGLEDVYLQLTEDA